MSSVELLVLPGGAEGVDESMDERALIAAAAAGDRRAQARVFDDHAGDVYRFLARFAGADDRDLDDLVQQSFLAVFRAAGSFRGEAPLRAWILGVARNVARSHVRGEVRRKRLLRAEEDRSTAPEPGPCEVAQRRQLLDRVAEAVAALPPDLRDVLVLCDVSGVAGVDVARLLGVPPGTVWRRLHQARKRVRRHLGEES